MQSSWKAQPSFLLSLASLHSSEHSHLFPLLPASSVFHSTGTHLSRPLQTPSTYTDMCACTTQTWASFCCLRYWAHLVKCGAYENNYLNITSQPLLLFFFLELLAEESGLHPHKLQCKIILLENSHHLLLLSKRLKQI